MRERLNMKHEELERQTRKLLDENYDSKHGAHYLMTKFNEKITSMFILKCNELIKDHIKA